MTINQPDAEIWQTLPLSELTFNHDGKRRPVREVDRKKGSFPYYGASGIVDYVESYIFDGEYLLVAEDGENLRTRQTPIAFMAKGKFWVNNHAHIVTGNEKAETRFLMYVLQGIDIQPYLTGAVMPKLTQGNLNRIPIPCPSLDIQRAIAHILGTLDDKIELNRRINQTLEQIAQAMFKSWFIDFDPVKAKIAAKQQGRDPLRAAMCVISGKADAELDQLPREHFDSLAATAALFPDELVDSDLGEIPMGWKIQSADEVSEVGIGKTPPRKEPQWFTDGEGDYRWLSIRDMGLSGVFQQKTSEYLTAEAVSRFNVRVVPDHTVVLSFKLTVGRVSITDGVMVTNEAIAHFKLAEDALLTAEYLYLCLKDFDYASLGSTSSIADAVNSKTIRDMKLLIPAESVGGAFRSKVSPLFLEIKARQSEIETLSNVRDELVPKLMSGEVEVSI